MLGADGCYLSSKSVWAISSAIGPPIGGALANGGNWRWLFCAYIHTPHFRHGGNTSHTSSLGLDLNLPLSGIAILLVLFFLNLPTPRDSLSEKFARMDWM